VTGLTGRGFREPHPAQLRVSEDGSRDDRLGRIPQWKTAERIVCRNPALVIG
jgi:hypothetical protein